ncbi:MAG: hypothetical protein RSE54_04755 [Ruthenibacterium sp.]
MVKNNIRIQRMCIAALLCAVGILIPMLSPVKLQFGPMSFTLASHVALFLAMFVSPAVGATVAVGTTLGFVLAGFPPVVVLRAGSQLVFVLLGAIWLAKSSRIMEKGSGVFLFGLAVNAVHAVCEAIVVMLFWFGGATYNTGFWYTILVLVVGGTLIHGMVDYYLALLVWIPVQKVARVQASYMPLNAKKPQQ